jgi:hypothetical protein
LNDQVARVYGDIGVTHGLIVLNIGVDRSIVVRGTGVYIMHGGQWQVMSWQSTPVPESK